MRAERAATVPSERKVAVCWQSDNPARRSIMMDGWRGAASMTFPGYDSTSLRWFSTPFRPLVESFLKN
jgi:hypothetical protein